MDRTIRRRTFLAVAGTAAAAALAGSIPTPARHRADPTGPVCGRTGPGGLPAGSPGMPARGPVVLLDGRVLEASHVTSWAIGPGQGVLLAPDGRGSWSVLYAEA